MFALSLGHAHREEYRGGRARQFCDFFQNSSSLYTPLAQRQRSRAQQKCTGVGCGRLRNAVQIGKRLPALSIIDAHLGELQARVQMAGFDLRRP